MATLGPGGVGAARSEGPRDSWRRGRGTRLLVPVTQEDEASLAEAGLCRVWRPVAKRVILELFFSWDDWGKQGSYSMA